MRENLSTGYVLEASKLTPCFPEELQDQFTELVNDLDWEGAVEFCQEHWPEDYPVPETFFHMSDEDTSEDIERGVLYVVFDEGELYQKIPKQKALTLALKVDAEPQIAVWSIFG